jgi:hypothetical protein
VDHHLEPDEWAELTPAERVRRCRAMASEAQRFSSGTEGEIRNIYFALSLNWLALASEIERAESEPSTKS